MKNVVVTGANGFIGSAVINELIKNNIKVYAVHRKNSFKNIPKSNNVINIECDLLNLSNLSNLIKDNVDTFYHFAWNGSGVEFRADTKLQLQNVQWTIDALNVAKELGCSRFLGVGTIMEHETISGAYTQGNRPGLGYIYGGAKLAAHTMCMSVANKIGIDLVWCKITNAYGVGEISSRMVNTTIKKIIKGECPQFTSGTQTYDFVYIDDVARAFYLIGQNGKPFNDYIIGSGEAKPLKEFLLEMKESISPNLDFIFGDIPFTGIDLPLEIFDCTHTKDDTGFVAKIPFGTGTKITMEWIKEISK